MKNKNSFYTLIVALFFSITAFAQPATDVEKSYAPTTAENSLLWKISGGDLTQSSYLYGTIHMIPADKFIITDLSRKTLSASDRVVFEIDTEEMSDPSAMMGMLSAVYMNNDTTLADLISEEDYALVDEHFAKMGMPLSFLEKIKPMFLSIIAMQDTEGLDLEAGGNPFEMGGDMKSYEMELTAIAQEQEKPITGLETMEFQMSLFDSIPYSAQAVMLIEAVKGTQAGEDDENINSLDFMVELYLNEDIVAMQQLMMEESAGMSGFEDLLLNKRNRNWIPIMEEMMAEESTFFAVGAGHLGGEEGVISLLRQAGYSVKSMKKK